MVLKLTFQDRTEGLFAASAPCLADLDGDGTLAVRDFVAFREAHMLADLRAADFDGDGAVSDGDFVAYRAAFLAGCP